MTKIGESYRILLINDNGSLSVYTGKVLEEDDLFLKFQDKFNKEIIAKKLTIKRVEQL